MRVRRFKSLKFRDILSQPIDLDGVRSWLVWQAAPLIGLALGALLSLSGCASTVAGDGSGRDAAKKAGNLGCIAARVLVQQCQVAIELDRDTCQYAEVIARVCDLAELPSLLGAPTAGSGYTPRGLTTFWRDTPGSPEKRGVGDLSADPWAVACSGKVGSALAACLRSRFLESNPAVCAEYARAFGVTTCGTPAGGWTRGPSNERWGSALNALNYFCENDPAVIGSTGRAGGWDCESTAVDWARLGAFGGEAIVTEWQKRTNPPAPVLCPNGRPDPGETCRTCPQDLGACPPPPPPPPISDGKVDCAVLRLPSPGSPLSVYFRAGTNSTGSAATGFVECRVGGALPPPSRPELSAQTRQTLSKLCGLYPKGWTKIRAVCAAAVAEVLGVNAIAAQIELEELAGEIFEQGVNPEWALEPRPANAPRGEPFYQSDEVACYHVSDTEDFCEPIRKAGGVMADAETFECVRLQVEAAAAGEAPPSCVGLP